jgi:cobalt/nickel transport system permease protein
MHIPDGFLAPNEATGAPVWPALLAASAAGIGVAVWRARKRLGEKHVPLMGVMGAFVFAAQMLNFPVAGGTSGHFMGAALIAALLGPFAALIVMTSVLVVQCFLFQDGGVFALGANIFNMGIAGGMLAYLPILVARKMTKSTQGLIVGAAIGAWLSIVAASSACAFELVISKRAPLGVALPTMAGVHAVIGVGEALITAAALGLVLKARPDLADLEKV